MYKRKCIACTIGSPTVSDIVLEDYKGQHSNWNVIEERGAKKIIRKFKFSNFKESLEFANIIGDLAEENQHHPSILVEWGSVTVSWWTHKINGIHSNDLLMASETDLLFDNFKL